LLNRKFASIRRPQITECGQRVDDKKMITWFMQSIFTVASNGKPWLCLM